MLLLIGKSVQMFTTRPEWHMQWLVIFGHSGMLCLPWDDPVVLGPLNCSLQPHLCYILFTFIMLLVKMFIFVLNFMYIFVWMLCICVCIFFSLQTRVQDLFLQWYFACILKSLCLCVCMFVFVFTFPVCVQGFVCVRVYSYWFFFCKFVFMLLVVSLYLSFLCTNFCTFMFTLFPSFC